MTYFNSRKSGAQRNNCLSQVNFLEVEVVVSTWFSVLPWMRLETISAEMLAFLTRPSLPLFNSAERMFWMGWMSSLLALFKEDLTLSKVSSNCLEAYSRLQVLLVAEVDWESIIILFFVYISSEFSFKKISLPLILLTFGIFFVGLFFDIWFDQ